MEATGVGVSIKVERRIPIGDEVMVILMVSSISVVRAISGRRQEMKNP